MRHHWSSIPAVEDGLIFQVDNFLSLYFASLYFKFSQVLQRAEVIVDNGIFVSNQHLQRRGQVHDLFEELVVIDEELCDGSVAAEIKRCQVIAFEWENLKSSVKAQFNACEFISVEIDGIDVGNAGNIDALYFIVWEVEVSQVGGKLFLGYWAWKLVMFKLEHL